jgi:predicted  nucleic acid-binding Zn-ribbon protein
MDAKMPMQKLLDVQNVDLKIQGLETEVAAIPLRVHDLEAAIEARRADMVGIKSRMDEARKAQRQVERKLDQKQGELSKYNAQLPLIKTNREYKAILVEIDGVEKEISDLEEEILVKMSEVEEMEKGVAARNAEVDQAEKEVKEEIEKLKQKKQELERLLGSIRAERKDLASGIDEMLLSRYDKIRVRKGGLAISKIDDESCGACHLALPPQVVNEVIGGKVKSCPSCNRLLYWNEE